MSTATPTAFPATIQPHRNRGNIARTATQSAYNQALFVAMMGLLALAPLPFGSVRAFVWGIWAIYLGAAGLIYGTAMTLAGHRLRLGLSEMTLPALLFGATLAYLLVQLLPLGTMFGPFAVGDTGLSTLQISVAPSQTLLMLVRQLSYGLFVVLLVQCLRNEGRRALFFRLLLLLVLAYGLYGLIALGAGDTILGLPKWAYFGSATGPFVNRNSFATFLAFGAVIAATLAGAVLLRQHRHHRDAGRIRHFGSDLSLYALAYGLLIVVIIATRSRMGLFSALSGTGVVILLCVRATGSMRLLGTVLAAAAALVATGMALFGRGLLERVGNIEQAADVRGALYRQTLELIAQRPWTGFGGGTFELAFPLVHDWPVSFDRYWMRAHNTYLTLWSELGLVFGSLLMLAVGWCALRLLAGILRGRGSWTAQAIGLGAITVAAVHSLADFSLEIQANCFLFLALVAAGLAGATASRARQPSHKAGA